MKKIKYAKDLIKANTNIMCGFDSFINGRSEPKRNEYGDKSEWYGRFLGYQKAKEMAQSDGIAFIHPFQCGKSKSCHPFEYGGFFVCNACGNKNVDKEWWKIEVVKDGNMFHCRGLDFVNIQESENHAFGTTFHEAINNYQEVILTQQGTALKP